VEFRYFLSGKNAMPWMQVHALNLWHKQHSGVSIG